jgi:imidazolonepropionase-like amidohydrolase
MTTLLTNCHVIPCITEGEAIIHDAAVLIEGKRIKAVGKAADFGDSEGVQIRDLGGRYVMPGLMNMNVHLGLSLPGATQAAAAKETEMDLFARALKNAHDALHAGVTFVRCVGEKNGLDFALRRAFTSGLLQGQILFVLAAPSSSPAGMVGRGMAASKPMAPMNGARRRAHS